jgi:formylmethanofuran dehydrogenase subunit D
MRGLLKMFSRPKKRNSKEGSSTMNLGEVELQVDEAYIADKGKVVARIDKESMKELHISAGDAVIVFAEERPVIVKAFPLYPSDNNSGVIKINSSLRNQLRREVGDTVTVRGIGNTKIDKVVNYLLFEELSKQGK